MTMKNRFAPIMFVVHLLLAVVVAGLPAPTIGLGDQAAVKDAPAETAADFEKTVVSVEASSEDGSVWAAKNVAEWNWLSRWRAKGETEGAWVQLNFAGTQRVGAVQIVDRANERGEVAAVRLSFSDGSHVDYLLSPHPNYPGLNQPGIVYTPVDEHLLAAYAKASDGIVHAWDAHAYDLSYARDKGSFFIRFEPRKTAYVRVTITKMVEKSRPAGEPFAATLAFVRPVFMPDDAQPLASEEQLQLAARTGFALTDAPRTDTWTLQNEEFRLDVSPATGLASRFTSLLPSRVDLCADQPQKPGTVLYLQCVDRDWNDRFDRLLSWRRSEGSEGGQQYQELVCVIAPRKYPVATATVRYRLFPDRLEQQVRFDYLVQDWARYRIGLYHQTEVKQWPEHRDTGGWNSTREAYVRAYSHAYDLCWEQGDWHCLMWPLDVLRREDRYLAWGSFDLQGPHMVMGPHIPVPGAYPSVYYMPLYLRQGDSYTLDLFWKSFPRKHNGYAEVLNWYARRTRFDDPELAGIPVRLTQERPRTLPEGRLAPSVRPGYPTDSEKHLQKMEAAMVRAGVRHVVYGGWDAWVHPPENIGKGTEWRADVGRLTAEIMQQDILKSRQSGLRSYLYVNQFCKPPWRGGELVDADNPQERGWFLERAKSFYRTLKPDGIFWDTGWHPISWSSPNIWISSNPRGDQLKGWLKIYARLYTWIKENYRDNYVISGAAAAPTAFFADAVHTEGEGGIASPAAAEDSRAFMQPLFAYLIPPYHDLGLAVFKKHGLKQQDLVQTGLPPQIEAEIWDRWMRAGLKSVGLGRSLITQGELLLEPESVERRKVFPGWRAWAFYFPQTQKTPELDRFCARATAVPLMWETRALTTEQKQVFGSVWAAEREMLVSLYHDGDKPATVRARIDRNLLRDYGFAKTSDAPRVHVLSPLAFAQPERSLKHSIEPDAIYLYGELRPGELALIFWPAGKRTHGDGE